MTNELDDEERATLAAVEQHRERVRLFLIELSALTERTGIQISACSCCQGVQLLDPGLENDDSEYAEFLADEVRMRWDPATCEMELPYSAQLGHYNGDKAFKVVGR